MGCYLNFPGRTVPKQINTLIFCIVIIFLGKNTYAQELKFGRINYQNYPEMECSFSFINSKGEKDFSLQVADFDIKENNKETEIIEVINPQGDSRPVSVVLIFDVSASMQNERLALAKEAARGFLDQFPLESSEVAIASFSDQVYLNCDFTQDINRLKETIDDLVTFSGTNYTRAFMNKQTGALDISRNGRFKKAIVFLTDGLSSTDSEEIIKQASYEGITVYCITLALKMPQILKDIATHTGGKYYEAVTNIYQLHNFYASICQLLQTTGYSILRWRAIDNCDTRRLVKLKCRNIPIEFSYDVPNYLQGAILTEPGILFFSPDSLNPQTTVPLTLTAINQSFTINSLNIAKKDYFSIDKNVTYPIILTKGESKKINISYSNTESGIVSDKLTINPQGCPSLQVILNGGKEEQLKLIAPKGKEVFTVGIDTAVIWDGIKRTKYVNITYSTNNSPTWKKIGYANGLHFDWKIPNDTSSFVKVKIEPAFSYDRDFKLHSKLGFNQTITEMYPNSDGSLILTVDKSGILQLWNGNTLKLVLTLSGFAIKYAILSPDSKRIIGFTGSEMFVWDIGLTKLIARYTYRQKLYVSNVDPDGIESLLSTRVYKDISEKTKAWSPGSNILIPIPEIKNLTDVSINQNGLKAVTIDADNRLKIWNLSTNTDIANIKINPEIISVIINPTGEYIVSSGRKGLKMYDLNTGEERFELFNDIYKKFSPNGQMMVTTDGVMTINIWELATGKHLIKLFRPKFYKLAYTTNKVLFYRNDTLSLIDLSSKTVLLELNNASIVDAILSPNENILLLYKNDNSIDVYDFTEQKIINNINEFDGPVQQIKFSADSKNILVTTAKNELYIFKPQKVKKLQEVISDYFSIIAPKITVKDTIQFSDQIAGVPAELLIEHFISNTTKYPVTVLGMKIVGADSADFKLVSSYLPTTIQGNTTNELEMRFSPATSGIKKATLLTFTPNDTLHTILIGKSLMKSYEISSEIIDFGKVKVGESKDSLVLILKNTSESSIIIEKIENLGPNQNQFTINNPIGIISLETGQNLTIPVAFKPSVRGRISGNLGIKIKELEKIQKINLFGEGIASREVYLTGYTLNSTDSVIISANVTCTDLLSGLVIQKFQTKEDGRYVIRLNCDRNYGITAEKDSFISGSENIDLQGIIHSDTIKQDIYLTQIKSGAVFRMNCVFFDFAKWDLLPLSKTELNRLVEMMTQYPKINIEIYGHTDSIGSEQSNMVLSYNRVKSVRNYLIKQGIIPGRLSIMYFGETKPVTSNTTEQGRARNRRVEVMLK